MSHLNTDSCASMCDDPDKSAQLDHHKSKPQYHNTNTKRVQRTTTANSKISNNSKHDDDKNNNNNNNKNENENENANLNLNLFQTLISTLSQILGPTSGISSTEINPTDLIHEMTLYTSTASHWSQYAHSDPSRNYTRNLVDEGNGKSNLLIVVWNPGKGSPIHDHADAHCIMKVLKGELKEVLYRVVADDDDDGGDGSSADDDDVVETSGSESSASSSPLTLGPALKSFKSTTYRTDEVTYISDQIGLHKITNASETEVAVSLHLYTPPHAANFGFNLFDERTGKATKIKQAGFFSDRGKKCEGLGTGIGCL